MSGYILLPPIRAFQQGRIGSAATNAVWHPRLGRSKRGSARWHSHGQHAGHRPVKRIGAIELSAESHLNRLAHGPACGRRS